MWFMSDVWTFLSRNGHTREYRKNIETYCGVDAQRSRQHGIHSYFQSIPILLILQYDDQNTRHLMFLLILQKVKYRQSILYLITEMEVLVKTYLTKVGFIY